MLNLSPQRNHNSMKSIHRTTRVLIVVLIIVCAVYTALYLLWGRIQNQNMNVSSAVARIADETNRANSAEELKGLLQESIASRTLLDSFILSSEGVVDFATLLEGVGKTVHASSTIDSFSESDIKSALNVGFLNVQMHLSGTWPQVYRMIVLIENLPYTMKIDDVRFQPVILTGSKTNTLWSAAVSFSVLKYK